jgi:bifunctional ADP-heptose synthase (sugar kinase/adenylyltransferase)
MNEEEFVKMIKKNHIIDTILPYLNKINNLNVLVIGETIIDEYQYGYTLGKSGKSPVVAFKNENMERYGGGILAIINHLNGIVKQVDYWTHNNVSVKKRYIQNSQKLFETYRIIKMKNEHEYLPLSDYDLVIVADFGHGMITKEMREQIQDEAKFIALNCQLNAGNMGLNTINKYENADYICVSENELRLALSSQFDDLQGLIKDNIEQDVTLSITQGNNGSLIYRNDEFVHIPAYATNVIDSTGAGDTFLAITSPLAYINAPLDVIGIIGNCAGALACSWHGNKYYIDKINLCNYIKNIFQ